MKNLLKIEGYLMDYCHEQEDDIQYVPIKYLKFFLKHLLSMDSTHMAIKK
jgi:hypothetical protein